MNFRALAAPALLALLVVPAFAQRGGSMQNGGMQKGGSSMQKGGMKKPMMMKKSISGIVKGNTMGHMFMMGSKMGQFKVDATKAQVRMMGKFYKLSDLHGGDMVTVMGMVRGNMVMADEVNVTHKMGMKKGMMGGKPMGKSSGKMMPKKG